MYAGVCATKRKTWKETRKRVGTPASSMPVGLMWMDILAWRTRRNKERKVFFVTGSGEPAAEPGRGRAVYPTVQFLLVIYLIVFFPLGPKSSEGRLSTKERSVFD